MKYTLILFACLALTLVVQRATAADTSTRTTALVEAEVAANAATVQRLEQAITAWNAPDKLSLLADAKLSQWAAEGAKASARVAEIRAVVWERYRADPAMKVQVADKDVAEARMAELAKTPGNEAEIAKLQEVRVRTSIALQASNVRLFPDLESNERISGDRAAQIALRLPTLLRTHSDGKALMVEYDAAVKSQEALDDEWLKVSKLSRPLKYLRQQPAPVYAKTHHAAADLLRLDGG